MATIGQLYRLPPRRAKSWNEQVAESAAAQGTAEGSGMRAVAGVLGDQMLNQGQGAGSGFARSLVAGGNAGGGAGLGGGLASSYQSAADEAKAKNEERYGEGKTLLTGLATRNAARVEGMGSTVAEDVNRNFNNQVGSIGRMYSGAGSGNQSSIQRNLLRANERERSSSLARAMDVSAARAITTDTADTERLAGWVERRNDVGPDFGQLAALSEGVGAANAGGMTLPQSPGVPPEAASMATAYGMPGPQAIAARRGAKRMQSYADSREKKGIARSQAVGFGPTTPAPTAVAGNQFSVAPETVAAKPLAPSNSFRAPDAPAGPSTRYDPNLGFVENIGPNRYVPPAPTSPAAGYRQSGLLGPRPLDASVAAAGVTPQALNGGRPLYPQVKPRMWRPADPNAAPLGAASQYYQDVVNGNRLDLQTPGHNYGFSTGVPRGVRRTF